MGQHQLEEEVAEENQNPVFQMRKKMMMMVITVMFQSKQVELKVVEALVVLRHRVVEENHPVHQELKLLQNLHQPNHQKH